MNGEDTNPNMVSIGNVYVAVKELRKENRSDHKAITTEMVAQGKDIACLKVKWRFLRWLVPASIMAAVGIVGLAYKFMG